MSIEDIKRLHDEMRTALNKRSTTTFDVDPALQMNMSQLGLRFAMVDQLGRIWTQEGSTLSMIFDPMWLHPSKRWAVPTDVPQTRMPPHG